MRRIYTYEMVAVADQNEHTYACQYGTYSQEEGFILSDLAKDIINDGYVSCLIDELFHEDLWKVCSEPKVKEMSLEDIEKELGYRVRIIDPEPKNKSISPERKKEVDEAIDFFSRLFGIEDIDPDDYY